MASEHPSSANPNTSTGSGSLPPVTPSAPPPSTTESLPTVAEKPEPKDLSLGALCYLLPIIGVLVLKNDTLKSNTYLRQHAVQGIALCLVLIVLSFILASIPGIGYVAPIAWLAITAYFAYQVYQGSRGDIPVITNLCRSQKWV